MVHLRRLLLLLLCSVDQLDAEPSPGKIDLLILLLFILPLMTDMVHLN
jgi:hypothetical protein